MLKRKIVAGNWKMNLSVDEGVALVSAIMQHLNAQNGIKTEVILAPPFLHLLTIRNVKMV